MRLFLTLSLAACFLGSAYGETYPLIIQGKVTMKDGSPPPKSVGIERICSDGAGSAPGPLTDKKGEYLWRMEVDPMRTRSCFLRATMVNYESSRVDISALNGYVSTTTKLMDLVLMPKELDPYTINTGETGVPAKGMSAWKTAMKALEAGNLNETVTQLQTVTQGSPKFARGWQTLGIVDEQLSKYAEAKDAYQHAIEADPKVLAHYLLLARACLRLMDWDGASKAADTLIKTDTKRTLTAVYLSLAAAKYGLKDLEGAEASVQDALKYDQSQKGTRAEYILGRILEAKGDLAGAKEHMTKYTTLDPNAADIETVKAHILLLGKPEAASTEPQLVL